MTTSPADLTDPKQLVQAALEYIEAHPEEHDQAHWRCQTGMCFAGHMANLHPNVNWLIPHPTPFDWEEDGPRLDMLLDETGREIDVSMWGRRFLFPENPDSGHAYTQAQHLFFYNNTLSELREMVEAYVEGRYVKRTRRDADADV